MPVVNESPAEVFYDLLLGGIFRLISDALDRPEWAHLDDEGRGDMLMENIDPAWDFWIDRETRVTVRSFRIYHAERERFLH